MQLYMKHLESTIALPFRDPIEEVSTWQGVCVPWPKNSKGGCLEPPHGISNWLRGLDLNQRPSGYENVLKFTAR
jgi:hypothetical protein